MKKQSAIDFSLPLGDLLRAWRAAIGASQAQAAAAIGMPVRTLQGLELGRPSSQDQLIRWAIRGHLSAMPPQPTPISPRHAARARMTR